MVGRKESSPSPHPFSVVHRSSDEEQQRLLLPLTICSACLDMVLWGWVENLCSWRQIKISSLCWNAWELSTQILYLENLDCEVHFLLEKLKETFYSCCLHSGLTLIWHWKHKILLLGCLGDTWIAWQQHSDCNWDRSEALGCLWVHVAAFMKWREELKHTFDFGNCSRN